MKRLDAREKVKLLAATYLDAVDRGKGQDTGLRSPFQSSGTMLHRRHHDLWEHGSYRELERAMDELRGHSNSHGRHSYHHFAHRLFWRTFVCKQPPDDARVEDRAERALKHVVAAVKRLTGDNIYVPAEVVENAGWTQQDAKTTARPRRLAA